MPQRRALKRVESIRHRGLVIALFASPTPGDFGALSVRPAMEPIAAIGDRRREPDSPD
jgi:hypothetical protein